jgi:hypothetical protein
MSGTGDRLIDVLPARVALKVLRQDWEKSRNPFFVWKAVQACARGRADLPIWVLDYMVGCANRMFAPETVESKDLRATLLTVFGFPTKSGRGHHLLKPPGHEIDEYEIPTIAFAVELEKGARPSAALRKAADHLPGHLINVDNKTLRANIYKNFGLKPSSCGDDELKYEAGMWLNCYQLLMRLEKIDGELRAEAAKTLRKLGAHPLSDEWQSVIRDMDMKFEKAVGPITVDEIDHKKNRK